MFSFRNAFISSASAVLFVCAQASAATVNQNNLESTGSESNGLTASGTVSTLSRVSLPTDGAGLASASQSMWLSNLGSEVAKSTATPETGSLQLTGLVPGTPYNVAFDLPIRHSWDGSASSPWGPDRWSLTVNSGGTDVTHR